MDGKKKAMLGLLAVLAVIAGLLMTGNFPGLS